MNQPRLDEGSASARESAGRGRPTLVSPPHLRAVEAIEERSVLELADPAIVFGADVAAAEVERWLATNPTATSVVVRHDNGRLEILTRRRLTLELAGPLGHGRSLYGRRPVRDLPGNDETLILDGSTPLADAAVQVIARPRTSVDDDFIVIGADGVIGTVSVARLFGDLARLHAHRAAHDRLTGLPNRELFVDRLRAQHGSVACLFIDLDDFKAINDSLGHSAGDELLIVVSERLRSASEAGEIVARLSGDEFGLLQPDGDETTGKQAAERIGQALEPPVTLGGLSVSVSASIGIAVATGSEIAPLLRNADIAMYESKRFGKARHTVYREEMFTRAGRRLELKLDIETALEREELHLVYQPIVTLGDSRTIGVEALLRWQHPRLGSVSPLEFITLAEESGAIVPIGEWVIEDACRQTVSWEREFDRELDVSVNVSVRQLERPEFPARVAAALTRTGIDPARVTLEITETAVAREGMALQIIEELAALGLRLAIDDFGTGFSSLERLERLPIDVIKIDRSFVAKIEHGGGTRLLEGMRLLADAMGVTVVAEGVETPGQLELLASLGFRVGQGFHMAKPLEPDELAARLRGEAPAS